MVEIPGFSRRQSVTDSTNLQDHPPIAGPVELPPARTTSTSKRLTKARPVHSPTPFRAWSDTAIRPERGSRHSLIEFSRKPLENRGSRFFQLFQGSSSNSLSEDQLLAPSTPPVDSANHFISRATTDTIDMSVDLLKTVAKKTSLKNLLCDKLDSSNQDPIDLDAAINLLKELKKRATPEELVALHRALLPVKSAGPSGENDEFLQSPYSRRSSVITPGLATRTKSPSKSPKERSSFLPWDISLTPQKRRPSSDQFTSAGGNVTPLLRHSASAHLQPHKGVPAFMRSYSPANLDIAAIGSLGLGTLRVTNGAVSPEPSIVSEAAPDPIGSASTNPRGEPDTSEQQSVTDQASISGNYTTTKIDRDSDRKMPKSDSLRELGLNAVKYLNKTAENKTEPTAIYHNHAFSASTGSFASRLSTILDDESVFMERNDEHDSDPRSNKRPDLMKKKDSGYLSDLQASSRCSSSEDEIGDLVQAAHLRTALRPMHMPLETIPSMSTLVSTAPASSNVGADSGSACISLREPLNLESRRTNDTTSQPSPLQSNPPITSGPTTPLPFDPENGKLMGLEKSQKPKNKLQKPPPHVRSKSDSASRTSTQPGVYPSVPDDLSINFSRRINRITGSFHPEHAYAANARQSKESLSLHEGTNDTIDRSVNPSVVEAAVTRSDTHAAPSRKDISTPEGEVKKKRSLFRLRGRTRSKSRTRPEAHLPLERDTPTVADTVPQCTDISAEKENHFRFPDDRGSRGASTARSNDPGSHTRPDKLGQSHRGAGPGHSSQSRVLADKSKTQSQASHRSGHRRSESVPRATFSSEGIDTTASQQIKSTSKQRSKSVAPPRDRTSRSPVRVADETNLRDRSIPRTPRMQSNDRWDPVTPSQSSRPLRDRSAHASSSDGYRCRSRGHHRNPSGSGQMNSPAYIAYTPTSPTPGGPHRSQEIPRTLPWETPLSPAGSRRQCGPQIVSDDREEDLSYRAYRKADAVSIRRLTSPTRVTQLRVPRSEQRPRTSRDSSRTPSPASVIRQNQGLDFGWEKDARAARR